MVNCKSINDHDWSLGRFVGKERKGNYLYG